MASTGALAAPPRVARMGTTASRSGESVIETALTEVDDGNISSGRSDPIRLSRLGPVLQVLASLLWLPQAGLLSLSIGSLAAGGTVGTVFWYASGVLLLGIARSVLAALGNRVAFKEARVALSQCRARAVGILASRSPLDPLRPASGLAASTLAEQAEAIVPYLSRFQPARLRATVVPLAILLSLLAYSWVAALVLLVAAPLIPIFMALVGWRAKAASEAQLAEMGGMNAFLLDRLRGLATIRALEAVEVTASRLRTNAENLRLRTMAVLRIAFLSSAVLELFAALGVAMVAVYVGFHLLGQLPFGAWGEKLSLGEGLFILLLAPAFFEPLRDLSAVWHDRAAGEAALDALRRLSEKGPELPGSETDQRPPTTAGYTASSVRIENLRFRYSPHGSLVFDGFNLGVASGEHIALLAPSGKGKSTLLALIAGLALPESGRILIGGEALSADNAARLRRNIAWIGQNPHVFAGTLSGNVTLGRPDIDRQAVRAAVNLAGLGEVAARRGPAPVGENGVGLSGGEALRLALARVIATPQAGLVLADEPTAHLDTITAGSITDALIAFARGRTLIVATHDPVLAARMDRVVDLTTMNPEGVA
ncbi:ATP-binding cassette subfamily C protein CydD [Rhizobium petrolearium]|uniref:thiol reductant ABC exporter subunit CydD n=1 Tax=Neorhizobium petrolearium TaxID=515361 RepID=UPI001F46278D|nr:thiol reductant ABC exporter subunit CydD [Neorhizobium petrolearium]MBP1843256.1 ATP-binding cassette subfamily C protein CydD [Neorhizobium petrolearium]